MKKEIALAVVMVLTMGKTSFSTEPTAEIGDVAPRLSQKKVKAGCNCCSEEKVEEILHMTSEGIRFVLKGGKVVIKGLTALHFGNQTTLNQLGTIFTELSRSDSERSRISSASASTITN